MKFRFPRFDIVEVMIVLAIVGILAAVAIPAIQHKKGRLHPDDNTSCVNGYVRHGATILVIGGERIECKK